MPATSSTPACAHIDRPQRARRRRRRSYADRARRRPAHRRARRQSDQASVDAAVATVLAEPGRIDVLMHNAGHMVTGPGRGLHPRAARRALRHQRARHAARQPRRAAAPARAARRPASSGSALQHPRRHPAVPGAVLRGEGGDGRAGGQLRRRGRAVRHRDHDRRARARSPTAPTTSRTPVTPPTRTSSRPTRRGTPG